MYEHRQLRHLADLGQLISDAGAVAAASSGDDRFRQLRNFGALIGETAGTASAIRLRSIEDVKEDARRATSRSPRRAERSPRRATSRSPRRAGSEVASESARRATSRSPRRAPRRATSRSPRRATSRSPPRARSPQRALGDEWHPQSSEEDEPRLPLPGVDFPVFGNELNVKNPFLCLKCVFCEVECMDPR